MSERQREIAIPNDLERVTKRGVIIADGMNPYDGCGTWSGAMVHLGFRGSAFLRKLNLDAFKQVVRIELQYDQNPEIIAIIGQLQNLDEAFFDIGRIHGGVRPLLHRRSQTAVYKPSRYDATCGRQ